MLSRSHTSPPTSSREAGQLTRPAGSKARCALERLAQRLLPLTAAIWCYGSSILSTRALPDDEAYRCAARALTRGESPYVCERYIYPPLLAQLEAAAARGLSETGVQGAMRALNVGASVWLALFAVTFWTEDRWRRALAAAALLWWSPNFGDALYNGNLGPLVCALALWGLSRWRVQPLAAGLMLGLSLALKPLGPAAWLLLVGHRPESGGRAPQLKAAATAAITAGVLSWPGRALLPELAARVQGHPEALHNVSLQRVAHLLGLSFAPHWQFLVVCAIALLFVRRNPHSLASLMHIGCASVIVSQPIVWGHTMVIMYPTLAAAITRATRAAGSTPREHLLRVMCVCLGCLCVAQCGMFGDLAYAIAGPWGAVVAATPLGLTLVLAGYAAGDPRSLHGSAEQVRAPARTRAEARND